METLILVIIGFCVGYVLGWIYDNTTKKVDGKQEVDDYMKKTYGEYWWKIKESGGGMVDARQYMVKAECEV